MKVFDGWMNSILGIFRAIRSCFKQERFAVLFRAVNVFFLDFD